MDLVSRRAFIFDGPRGEQVSSVMEGLSDATGTDVTSYCTSLPAMSAYLPLQGPTVGPLKPSQA